MMTSMPKAAKTFAVLTLTAIIGLFTPMLLQPLPRIIWNASPSVPIGWYLMSKRQPKKGEIGVIKPAAWVQLYASERSYLAQNVLLLKPIFATDPSTICRFGKYVFVDGKLVAKARIRDQQHRLLPTWKDCKTLKMGDVFLLASPRDSFDSRYFGPVNRKQIVGTAIPLLDVTK
jgi:conjugative transfer signal peptidase TraF